LIRRLPACRAQSPQLGERQTLNIQYFFNWAFIEGSEFLFELMCNM
jgi:hypothetical protein